MTGDWQNHQLAIDLEGIGDQRPFGRPLVLTLYAAAGNTTVAIDRVSLRSPGGEELLANGDFAAGSTRWFITSDDHLRWHVFSMPLHVLLEQGLVGLLLLAWIWARVVLMPFAARALAPEQSAAVAAMLGLAVVGLFNSLLDSPRVVLLVLVIALAAIGAAQPARRTRPIGARPRLEAGVASGT